MEIKYRFFKDTLDLKHQHYSEVFCKIHRTKLIHNKIILNEKTPIEVGYCYKCGKEYCEYSDINPIYISNYEWLYEE